MNGVAQTPAMLNASLFYAQFHGTPWVCYIPANLDFDKVLDPSYWIHCGELLKKWDRIQIRPDDASFAAELVVVDAGRQFARVALVSKVELVAQAEDPNQLEIEQVGTNWRVRRGKAVLADELKSRKDAERWIEDHTGVDPKKVAAPTQGKKAAGF